LVAEGVSTLLARHDRFDFFLYVVIQ
jgi:hypothetical protein